MKLSIIGGSSITSSDLNSVDGNTLHEGKFEVNIQSNIAQSVTFALIDSDAIGRPVAITSPTQVFAVPALTAVLIKPGPSGSTTQAYSPALHTNLALSYTANSVLFSQSQMRVAPSWSSGTMTMTVNGAAVTLSTSGTDSAIFGLNVGTNTIILTSVESGTYAYTFTVVRPGVDVTMIAFSGDPGYTSISGGAFASANFATRQVAVPAGTLRTLFVTVSFAVLNSVTIYVNSFNMGLATPNQPFDVTGKLVEGENTIKVATSNDVGAFEYVFIAACPVPYKTWRAPPNSDGCEYMAQICLSDVFHIICVQQRPECCGQALCEC